MASHKKALPDQIGTNMEPAQLDPSKCPIRDVLDQISGKWSVLVLTTLATRPHRFGELRRAIPDISQRMLTQSLRDLQRNGLVARQVFATVPPTVQYSLTDLGYSLLDPLGSLIQWSTHNHAAIRAARTEFDAESDNDLRPF